MSAVFALQTAKPASYMSILTLAVFLSDKTKVVNKFILLAPDNNSKYLPSRLINLGYTERAGRDWSGVRTRRRSETGDISSDCSISEDRGVARLAYSHYVFVSLV